MTVNSQACDVIHPSAYRDTIGPVRPAMVTARRHGALRYRCPVTGSYVLLTDEATLRALSGPRARLRCMDCGEMHLVTPANAGPAVIVAGPSRF